MKEEQEDILAVVSARLFNPFVLYIYVRVLRLLSMSFL